MKMVADEIKDPIVEIASQPPEPKGSGGFDGWQRDLRYAARSLWRKPAFSLTALLTLALGIGANTAIFSVVNATLLTPIAIPSPEQVVVVWTDRLSHGSTGYEASEPDFVDWQSSGIFTQLAGNWTEGCSLLIGNTPVRVLSASVTEVWFPLEGVKPYLGRLFNAQDMQPGHNQVVLLTYEFWHSRFGADTSLVGRTIIVNNSPYMVLGVLPKKAQKIATEDVYLPLVFAPPFNQKREVRVVMTLGRLAPGVTVAAAQDRMNALCARLSAQYPQEDGGNRIRLQPVEEAYVQDIHTLVLVLFGAVGFVLLVACANIANLLLVRGAGRHKELAIRSALGAGRWALMRQLLTESVLLSLTGGLLGTAPALLGIRLLAKYRPEALPNADLIGLNPAVLLFTLVLSGCTGLLFGIIPAWNSWRASAASPLRERSQTSSRDLRFGSLFVVAEVALTVILAIGAGLMLRSFLHLRSSYPGYDANVMTLRVSLTGKQYAEPEEQIKFCRLVLERLRSLPGIRNAAATDALPTNADVQGGMLHFTDRPESRDNKAVIIITPASPQYFDTMHIPLISGRSFTEADGLKDNPVLILDQKTAAEFWPNRDPIGQLVRVRVNTPLRRIVGIVGSVDRHILIKANARIGQVYLPFDQFPATDLSLAVSSRNSSLGLASSLHHEVSALAPDQAVYEMQTLEQARAAGESSSRFGTWLLGFFALLALALAAIGVYGVIAYTVEQRTRDIGVRMALGATQQDLLLSVLRRGLKLVGTGLLIGLCGALALGKLMGELIRGTSATDPFAFLGTIVLLLAAGMLATLIPAFRASRIDPIVALRHE